MKFDDMTSPTMMSFKSGWSRKMPLEQREVSELELIKSPYLVAFSISFEEYKMGQLCCQVGNRSVRDRIATPYVDASVASTEVPTDIGPLSKDGVHRTSWQWQTCLCGSTRHPIREIVYL